MGSSIPEGIGGFNPRARVGRDFSTHAQDHAWLVSIHAPAWGATLLDKKQSLKSTSFNPRARVGRDMTFVKLWRRRRGFNPRARVGRDSLFP